MPRRDDRRTPSDVDLGITIVFAIVLIAVLLLIRGSERTYLLPRVDQTDIRQPVAPVPPM